MIIFSNHSLMKLEQRGISKDRVIQTLNRPDLIASSRFDREIAYKKFDGLFLKVIFKKEIRNLIVITQYWTKETK